MPGLLGKKGDYLKNISKRESGNGLETFLDSSMLQGGPGVTEQSQTAHQRLCTEMGKEGFNIFLFTLASVDCLPFWVMMTMRPSTIFWLAAGILKMRNFEVFLIRPKISSRSFSSRKNGI